MQLPTSLLLAATTAALALVGGCGYPKSGPVPTAPSSDAMVKYPGAIEGRQLFSANCNKCHGYPDVNSVSEAEWPSIMDRMAKKAELTPAQREQVLHFVLASRGR